MLWVVINYWYFTFYFNLLKGMQMNRFGYLDAELFTNKCCYIGLSFAYRTKHGLSSHFFCFYTDEKIEPQSTLFCFLTSHNTSNIQEKNINTISLLHQRENRSQVNRKRYSTLLAIILMGNINYNVNELSLHDQNG